ncbi:redoxin domain-containing protein [Anaerobacillus sp. CMMVII]|nr:redoxin domain-containing protein [Anaerobacillus sp. CMMVII]
MNENLTNYARIDITDIDPCPQPFCATRDDLAPTFSAEALINNDIKTINLQDYQGKWVILFFYASDFTFV